MYFAYEIIHFKKSFKIFQENTRIKKDAEEADNVL